MLVSRELATRDERDVRGPHQPGDEPEHAIGSQDRAELPGLDEIEYEAGDQDRDRGFFPSHGFLHQGPVDQLADRRSEHALVVADEVLLGGRAGRRDGGGRDRAGMFPRRRSRSAMVSGRSEGGGPWVARRNGHHGEDLERRSEPRCSSEIDYTSSRRRGHLVGGRGPSRRTPKARGALARTRPASPVCSLLAARDLTASAGRASPRWRSCGACPGRGTRSGGRVPW